MRISLPGDVVEPHALRVAAGADAHERDAVAMARIHVGLDLEDEAAQLLLERVDLAGGGVARQRRRRVLHERPEQLRDAEIVDGRAEEDGCLPPGQVLGVRERVRGAADQFDFVPECVGTVTEELRGRGALQSIDRLVGARPALLTGLVGVDAVLEQVVDALQLAPHPDGPGDRRATDLQHLLYFVEQVERLAALAVELVDERHDRRVAQPADLHQLDRALLDALGAVDDHQRRVHGRQRAIGVLGEILVARRVEQVDQDVAVGELHDRRRDRDAALLLEAHPVGGRVPARLAAFDGPGHLDRAANKSSFSVSVVLPASGCEMMAKVRRRATSSRVDVIGRVRVDQSRTGR
jgi:hypothetical protein